MLHRIFAARCQKKRLVLNLRHVNQLVRKQKFKYEDLHIAMMLFRSGEYMIKSRVTTMSRWWRHIMGFDGPYVFSKLMRPLVKLRRSKGLKAVMYLDNGICAVKGKIEAQ